jgi:peptidoglycan/LPS O-acetylase OafA/YrhL
LKKIAYLEGLRGLACLLAVLSHFVVAFFPALYWGDTPIAHYPQFEMFVVNSPLNLFYSGKIAVPTFFILSGFVLSYKFFLHADKKIAVSGMLKRYIRLCLPVFCSMLILYLFLSLKLFFNDEIASYTKSEWLQVVFTAGIPTFKDIIKQTFFTTFFTGGTVYDHVLWTMCYELYGSFLVFIFLLVLGANRYRYIAYGLLAVIFWDSYYQGFIIGMVFSDLTAHEKLTKNLRVHFTVKAILVLLAIIAGSYPMGVAEPVGIYSKITFLPPLLNAQICHTLAAIVILFFAVTNSRFQQLLESRVVNFLGKVSFGMYLLHLIVIFSLSSFLASILSRFIPVYFVTALLACFLSFPVMLIFSWVFYKYIDTTSIRLANNFAAYILGRFSKSNKSV